MSRVWTICAAAILVFGCKSGEDGVRGRQGLVPVVEYRPPAEGPSEPAELPTPPEPKEREPVVEEAKPEGPVRDLGAELRAALGVPSDCVRDYDAPKPTKIRISVSGIVRPTGMIIEPTVYASGLSNAARKCIEQRVTTVVLVPLDEQTSKRASTVIEIDYQPNVVVQSDSTVPEPELRNVKEPLPKRPEVAPSGKPISDPPSKLISGGFEGGRPIQEPKSKKIKGPKPRPIDGYDLDENAQEWR
jgi:hypothetical protein